MHHRDPMRTRGERQPRRGQQSQQQLTSGTLAEVVRLLEEEFNCDSQALVAAEQHFAWATRELALTNTRTIRVINSLSRVCDACAEYACLVTEHAGDPGPRCVICEGEIEGAQAREQMQRKKQEQERQKAQQREREQEQQLLDGHRNQPLGLGYPAYLLREEERRQWLKEHRQRLLSEQRQKLQQELEKLQQELENLQQQLEKQQEKEKQHMPRHLVPNIAATAEQIAEKRRQIETSLVQQLVAEGGEFGPAVDAPKRSAAAYSGPPWGSARQEQLRRARLEQQTAERNEQAARRARDETAAARDELRVRLDRATARLAAAQEEEAAKERAAAERQRQQELSEAEAAMLTAQQRLQALRQEAPLGPQPLQPPPPPPPLMAECTICYERPRDTVLGCGHQLCATCAGRVDKCPTCRISIQTRIRLFD